MAGRIWELQLLVQTQQHEQEHRQGYNLTARDFRARGAKYVFTLLSSCLLSSRFPHSGVQGSRKSGSRAPFCKLRAQTRKVEPLSSAQKCPFGYPGFSGPSFPGLQILPGLYVPSGPVARGLEKLCGSLRNASKPHKRHCDRRASLIDRYSTVGVFAEV